MTQQIENLEILFDHSQIRWGQELEFPNSRAMKQYTHRIFNRYPARSIFTIPRSILMALAKKDRQIGYELNVLDPFLGSGTTAIETHLIGMRPFGVEADPFARLVSEVSTRAYTSNQLQRLNKIYQIIAESWTTSPAENEYLPNLQNISYWFSEDNFDKLHKLKTAIYRQASGNQDDLDFFRVVFADIIKPCSKAERQSLKPYISKKYAKIPADVGMTFAKSYAAHYFALSEFSGTVVKYQSPVKWIGDDATRFVSEDKIDIAITSPPYINALDYIRCIKLESAWAGCADNETFASVREKQVGERPKSKLFIDPVVKKLIEPYVSHIRERDRSRSLVVEKYFQDMYNNLASVFLALRNEGEYHLIVGNSTVRQVEIPTHEIIAELGQSVGFEWTGYYKYIIKDHRTSIPRMGNGGKIKHEHVITMKKSSFSATVK